MNDELNKKIVEDFGLQNMDQGSQEEMISKIGNLLFESVTERAVDEMDEPTMSDFDAILSEAGSDYKRIISFFKERVPGFDGIVSDELHRLKRATSGIFA